MRATKRRRPRTREKCRTIEAEELVTLAGLVTYIGSPEHKEIPSPAGHPKPRADASICEASLSRSFVQPTRWLKAAFRAGAVGNPIEGNFPRYAWYRNGQTVYEARLVNRVQGEYKGYPLERHEWPKFL